MDGFHRMRRSGSEGRLVPEADTHPAALDLQFGQMIALQQVGQLLNLSRLFRIKQHLVGPRGPGRKCAGQHDGFACPTAFSGLFP